MPANSEIKRARKILSALKKEYPVVKPALAYNSPFELLVSTILSAQCTDARVNIVTKTVFKKYKKPDDYVNVSDKELQKDIYSTGFFKQKAKSIKKCCTVLIEEYNSKVPNDFNKLLKLPGVGRKTASVVAGNAFGIPSIPVDTHVKRLSNLLGFVKTNNVDKIEGRLKELFLKKDWINLSHWIISHGRNICIARRPKCMACVIGNICPSFKEIEK
jgi:endonuclease-3